MGSVVIKFTPGHTPGHQSLFLKLKKTGNVLLSGRPLSLSRRDHLQADPVVPNWDKERDRKEPSHDSNQFVKKNHAQLWIQHDYTCSESAKSLRSFTNKP